MVSETAAHVVRPLRARESHVDRVLALILAGKSQQEICRETPISRSSLWRLRKCEAFQLRLKKAREAAMEGAVSALHSAASTFVKTLVEVCTDPKSRDSARATAARSGLDSLWKSSELFDMAERLAKLEEAAKAAAEGEK